MKDLNILDNIEVIKGIDVSMMVDILSDFPRQCERAAQIGEGITIPQGYFNLDRVVFTGLGGSAISGDMVKSYLWGKIRLPIIVNREYELPAFVDEKTLVFAVSYSGNTEETLSAYNEAKARKAKVFVITSGGKLKETAEEDGFPYVIIPRGLPPRTALGHLFFPALSAFSKMGLIDEIKLEFQEMVFLLKKLRDEMLGSGVPAAANMAKELALKIYGKFPVVYGASCRIDTAVTRWRTQLAENSKTLGSSHFLPEMNHNEIVGWENPKKLLKDFLVVILRDSGEHDRVKKRMEITKSIIESKNVQIEEVWSKGVSLLSRIFSLIYIGDFVSFYLAILNDVDPTPVERIDYLKRQLQ